MPQPLFPASDSTIEVDIPADILVEGFGPVAAGCVDDPREATIQALDDPVGFPPLGQAIVPADHIAIALHADVPRGAEIVAGVLASLEKSQMLGNCDLQLVYSGTPEQLRELHLEEVLPADHHELLEQQVHQPDDTDKLAYLAAAEDASPIYLNRALCDADVVIPISLARLEGQLGYVGIHEGLFPAFTDRATQDRFLVPANHQGRQLIRDANEAAWLLGIQLMILVIPGPGNSVLEILAGLDKPLAQDADQLSRGCWSRPRQEADMVIATVECHPGQDGWPEVARALHNARQLLQEDGALVLCSNLDCPPGVGLESLRHWDPNNELADELLQLASHDALAAVELAAARRDNHVYLLSQLPQDTVESLGLAYLSESGEITRLCRSSDRCILLPDAHRAVIQ